MEMIKLCVFAAFGGRCFLLCFVLNMARLCQDSRSQQNYFDPCFLLHLEWDVCFALELFKLSSGFSKLSKFKISSLFLWHCLLAQLLILGWSWLVCFRWVQLISRWLYSCSHNSIALVPHFVLELSVKWSWQLLSLTRHAINDFSMISWFRNCPFSMLIICLVFEMFCQNPAWLRGITLADFMWYLLKHVDDLDKSPSMAV